ncbi:MAG TPA: MATE family efflux transporter, partial [Leptospiraceae bacterium]|nr:MATE family efflux transporter [Leptospiraceae bacterium]
ISFMPGIAFGIAGTTLFGQSAGAKKWNRAEISIYRSANYALLIMGTMGLIFIIMSRQIISLFTDSAAVILDTVPCLFVMGLAQGADAYHMTFGAALRSAGMVNWVLIVYLIASYAVMLPIAWILGIYFSLGSIGLWISVAVWLYFLGIVFFLKFRKKEWKGVSF